MEDFLNKTTVLVLNRNWQAIGVKTPLTAIPMVCTDAATCLNFEDENSMYPVKWEDWMKLPVRPQDQAIHTVSRIIRVPTVIVLANFSKVPRTRPRLSLRNIWSRDGGICQYTGKKLSHGEGNIDHVTPRAKGGGTTWENCVLAHKKVNSEKADRHPEEAGLSLIRKPKAPLEIPVSANIRNFHGVRDWDIFLIK